MSRLPAVTPDKLPGVSVLPHPSRPWTVSNSLPGAVHKHINSTIQHKTNPWSLIYILAFLQHFVGLAVLMPWRE